MTKKIIVTGFEPFGGEKDNPTKYIAENINGRVLSNGTVVEGILMPVSVKRTADMLISILEEKKPDILIMTGLSGKINDINLERVAINILDARIPDNDGNKPVDELIDKDGETAYFSTLPVRKILEDLHLNKIPASISNSAGTYICNYGMYLALNFAKKHGYPEKTGFIHVPFMHEQVLDRPALSSMDKDTLLKAVEISILSTLAIQNNE